MRNADWLLGRQKNNSLKIRNVVRRYDMSIHWKPWLDVAYEEALKGLQEGGLPIGSVLVNSDGEIVARGHNLRVQTGDPTAHAEVVCIRNAGRRRDWHTLTLISTLSPCIMCTGTSLLYKIPTIVIGENTNFMGAEDLFHNAGCTVVHANDERCIQMMKEFVRDFPDLWNEDIGVPSQEP